MPTNFLKCVEDGGKVRTKKLKNNKYIKLCFINGKTFHGEIMSKKVKPTKWNENLGK